MMWMSVVTGEVPRLAVRPVRVGAPANSRVRSRDAGKCLTGVAGRFADRRDLTHGEASAVGIARLRISLLPAASQPASRQLHRPRGAFRRA
jgi:hypothetical protein